VRAALVEEHAAFLIDEGLQQFELCFSKLNLGCYRSHDGRVWRSANVRDSPAGPDGALLHGRNGFRGLLKSFDFLVVQQL
jgi:hypothetical protein